jgi:hypothetical protein
MMLKKFSKLRTKKPITSIFKGFLTFSKKMIIDVLNSRNLLVQSEWKSFVLSFSEASVSSFPKKQGMKISAVVDAR